MSNLIAVLKAAGRTPETIEEGAAAVAALRLQEAQTQERLAAARAHQARVMTPGEDDELRSRLRQLEEEKEDMRQALLAVTEQLKKLGSQRENLLDEKDRERLVRALHDEQAKTSKRNLETWKARLKEMPRVTITNPTDETIILTVNRVSVYVLPGENSVPAAYEDAWNDYIQSTKEGKARERALSAAMEYGDLATWINTGRHNSDSVEVLSPFSE